MPVILKWCWLHDAFTVRGIGHHRLHHEGPGGSRAADWAVVAAGLLPPQHSSAIPPVEE